MKLVSIDVGVKNLSCCMLDENSNILVWSNLDLTVQSQPVFVQQKCSEVTKHKQCIHPAAFICGDLCVCTRHSKKRLLKTAELSSPNLKKQKKQQLLEIAQKYNIELPKEGIKATLIDAIEHFVAEHCFVPLSKPTPNANYLDLVKIGRNLQSNLDKLLADHLPTIDRVIIENQMKPRMKVIQGMIMQYFIMRGVGHIEFVNAIHKLEDFATPSEKKTYKQRKHLGVQTCATLLANSTWLPFFKQYKKKDDLADCFLQGLWYLKNKI